GALEGEVGPLDEDVLALARRGRDVVVVTITVRDGADARRRHEALHGDDQVVQPALQVVDHHLHAAGGVDDDRDVEADLAQAADVLSEGAVERDPEIAESDPATTPATDSEPARARARRREAGAEIGAGADG